MIDKLKDIEQDIFILNDILEHKQLTAEEEKEIKKEIANLKRQHTILEKEMI